MRTFGFAHRCARLQSFVTIIDLTSCNQPLFHHCLFQATSDELLIPALTISAEDLKLRNETVMLLNECKIDSSCWLFQSDKVLPGLEHICISLVDHNHIQNALESLSERVDEIVDHHKDMGKHEVRVACDEATPS